MNPHFLASYTAGLFSLFLGISTWGSEKRSKLKWHLGALSLATSFWSIGLAFLHIADSEAHAFSVYRVIVVVPFFLPSLTSHFLLAYSQFKYIKSFKFIGLLYLPSLLFLVLHLAGNFIERMEPGVFGWVAVSYLPPALAFLGYSVIVYIFGIVTLFRSMKKMYKKGNRRYARYLGWSVVIGSVLTLLTEAVFKPLSGLKLPEFSNYYSLIWLIAMYLSMHKFRFLYNVPEVVWEKIAYNMLDILLLVDENCLIKKVNHQFLLHSKLDESAARNKPIGDFFENFHRIEEELNAMSQLNPGYTVQSRLVAANGLKIPYELVISQIWDDMNDFLGYVFVGHDIREKKKLEEEVRLKTEAEKALVESIQLYELTINALHDAIFVIDRNYKVILVNKAMRNFLQTSPFDLPIPDFTINSFLKFFPVFEADGMDEYRQVFQKGEALFSAEQLSINGRELFVEILKIPLNVGGVVDRVVTIVRNITARKKYEEQQLRSEISESLSLLSGGIVHDYNNILTGILGNLDLAKQLIHSKDALKPVLEDAEQAALSAKELTSQLLTFSKGGSPVIETGPIDKILWENASFYLRGSSISLEFDCQKGLWGCEFDENQLSRVFQNIFMNAKEAMSSRGVIKITLENFELVEESALALKQGKYVKIMISDDGPGIDKSILPRIFDPYFTTKKRGSGLGLASSYSIIQKHKGLMDVTSENGVGTCFIIYLPSRGTLKNRRDGVKDMNSEIGKGKGRILLMDDDDMVRRVSGKILEHLGYEVIPAEEGKRAVELYKKAMEENNPVDVVLLDLTVPGGMSGQEAFLELLKLDKKVKAVICSGYSSDPIISQYKDVGFKAVVQKPYTVEKLNIIISQVLSEP